MREGQDSKKKLWPPLGRGTGSKVEMMPTSVKRDRNQSRDDAHLWEKRQDSQERCCPPLRREKGFTGAMMPTSGRGPGFKEAMMPTSGKRDRTQRRNYGHLWEEGQESK